MTIIGRTVPHPLGPWGTWNPETKGYTEGHSTAESAMLVARVFCKEKGPFLIRPSYPKPAPKWNPPWARTDGVKYRLDETSYDAYAPIEAL